MDRIEALSAEEVQAVARETFRPENRTMVLGPGSGRSSSCQDRGLGIPRRASARRPSPGVAGAVVLPSLPELREERLPNGLRLLVQRRSDLPIVTLQADIRAGPLYEANDKAGLAELVARMLDRGIEAGKEGRKGSDEIGREVEFLGGDYSISASGLSFNLMSAHVSTGMDLIRDLLLGPTFSEDRLQTIRDDQLADLGSGDEEPQEVAWRLPASCWLAPLLWMPGVAWAGERVYRRIAAHRALACAVPAVRTPCYN
jgi:zinc protease